MLKVLKSLYLWPVSINKEFIEMDIYSDGSCHTQHRIGGWAAVLLTGLEKTILSGIQQDTTHNRMELIAVIEALDYTKEKYPEIEKIRIYSDSQYVIGLSGRREGLMLSGFCTKKGKKIPNSDLVNKLFDRLHFFSVEWTKIKAHQKKDGSNNCNIEVDKLSRKLVREALR